MKSIYDRDELFESDAEQDEGPMAWERRVFAVALAWSLPGVILGGIISLFLVPLGLSAGGLALGGIVGALAGGLLEADYWGP